MLDLLIFASFKMLSLLQNFELLISFSGIFYQKSDENLVPFLMASKR